MGRHIVCVVAGEAWQGIPENNPEQLVAPLRSAFIAVETAGISTGRTALPNRGSHYNKKRSTGQAEMPNR